MKRIAAMVLACWTVAAVGLPSWPVCSVRVGGKGGPAILIGPAPYTPLFFAGPNGTGRDEVLERELRQAADAGVPFFGFDVPLGWDTPDDQSAGIVDAFCKVHPDGHFFVRITLDADPAWLAEHPEECITRCTEPGRNPPLFDRLGQVSLGSVVWREAVAHKLATRVRQIAEGAHGARFAGVDLACAQPDPDTVTDYSRANQAAFGTWLRRVYKNDGALRAAWNDPEVSLDTATLGMPGTPETGGWGPFRDARANGRMMDMERFAGELVADTITYFAGVVKETTARRSLVGASCVPQGLGRLLGCKDVDIVHAPCLELEPAAGPAGPPCVPLDSLALHGKLSVLEDVAGMTTGASLGDRLSVARWSLGNALTHRCGIGYVDPLPDGRWQDATFWRAQPLVRRLAAEVRSEPAFQPQVALVVSEQAARMVRPPAWPAMVRWIVGWRAALERIGAPVGYYRQEDLPNLPASVQVIVLANAFVIDKVERRAIEKRLDQGNTVVWTYAPDIVGPDGVDCGRIGAITGMTVEPRSDEASMLIASALTEEEYAAEPTNGSPRFVVTAQAMDIVARYKATNEVSAAARPLGKGVSVYTATAGLPVGVLRTICARAGVHLYRDTPGMTGVAGHYLIVHTEDAGQHTFRWPYSCRTVERIEPPSRGAVPVDADHRWSDTLPKGTTAIYGCYAD